MQSFWPARMNTVLITPEERAAGPRRSDIQSLKKRRIFRIRLNEIRRGSDALNAVGDDVSFHVDGAFAAQLPQCQHLPRPRQVPSQVLDECTGRRFRRLLPKDAYRNSPSISI